jgi:ABC-type Na+ efflux pump permease subunit
MIVESIAPTIFSKILLFPVEYFRYLGVVSVGYIIVIMVGFWVFFFNIFYFNKPKKAFRKILYYVSFTCVLGISYIVLIGTLRGGEINSIFHSISIVVFSSTIYILIAKELKNRAKKLIVAYNNGEFKWN